MEVTTSLLFVLSSSIVLFVLRWILRRRAHFQFFKRHGIPGPEPSFFTGNMHKGKAILYNDVITKWLEEYGDGFGFFLGEMPYIVVKDLELLKQIFIKDFHVFHNRPAPFVDTFPLNESLADIKGKRWKDVRSLLTPSFTSGKMKLMMDIVNKKVDVTVSLVDEKAKKNEMFDIFNLVQGLTLDVIADCALAMKTRCQQDENDSFLVEVRDFFRFQNNIAVDLSVMIPFIASVMAFVNDHLTTSGKMTSRIVDSVNCVIDARKKNPDLRSNDLLQLMIENNKKGASENGYTMTDREIVANAWLYLAAGYETTSTGLAFTFHLLITHPDIQERLYQEIDGAEDASYYTIQNLPYLDQVFSESLRLYPPVTGFISRLCNQDHQVGPLTIPTGSNILAPVWDIHHDPDHWPDPFNFDPDRFSAENKTSINNMAYIPFGIGPRNCVGARFAQLESKAAIFKLLEKFRFEKCEKTVDPLPVMNKSLNINPGSGVYVRAVPRDAI